MTPPQFEWLLSKETQWVLTKGMIVIWSRDTGNLVYLVAKGKMDACTTLSKRIAEVGLTQCRVGILVDGDLSAWTGEMAF